jgi:hypothetical protein
MDENSTLGFKKVLTEWEVGQYEDAGCLVAWFNWEDGNENEEDRAYLAVTLTDTGSIEVGGNGVFVGITTPNTMPFESSAQEVVISGWAVALGREDTPRGAISFDKKTGILMKRRFQLRNKAQIKNLGRRDNLKDLLVENKGSDNLQLCQVVV